MFDQKSSRWSTYIEIFHSGHGNHQSGHFLPIGNDISKENRNIRKPKQGERKKNKIN
jgi:hypothetical protein